MRVLLSGGGTGGHVYPALAIAEAIKAKYPDAEIAFVGAKRGIENKLVPAAGYKLYTVDIMGISRKLTLKNIKVAYKILTSKAHAKRILKEFKPDVVIGTGGYASWPAVSCAASMNIPTSIVEQDAYPGIATRQLSKCADRIFISFEDTRKYLTKTKKGSKVILSGNPIRMSFGKISRTQARKELSVDMPYLLSLGGSLGALKINEAILDVMENYTGKANIIHTHACGSRDYEKIKAEFEKRGLSQYKNLQLVEYINDMPLRMAAADLVINRSGAITLAELARLGKPCILIPSPNVTADHQYKNAKVLADAGAAVLIKDCDLTGEVLSRAVRSVIESQDRQNELAHNISKFSHPDSLDNIICEIENLLKEKK